jgi:bifunctional NMN adenylyltransferase/nudix hydrolase
MDYNYCVLIGRFEPPHNSHFDIMRQGLKEAKKLIIILGSAKSAATTKNPFSYEQRVEMITNGLETHERSRVVFVPARDYHYNEDLWITEVQQRVNTVTNGDVSVCQIGSYKDSSSYYVKLFPQWDFIPAKSDKQLDATDIRNAMFSVKGTVGWGDKGNVMTFDNESLLELSNYLVRNVPYAVSDFILKYMGTPEYLNLKEEYAYIQKYKKDWANVPFPVTFNTVDAVVVQSGHILLVKRKHNPGKGLWALPGGFLKQSERLEAGAIRELKEETGIKVHNAELHKHIVDKETFDYPNRSLRGRTITTAFYIRLPNGELPEVKGADDAEKAQWIPLMDVASMEKDFFEDHGHIVTYFLNKGK